GAGAYLVFNRRDNFGQAGNPGAATPFDYTRFGGHAYLSSGDSLGRLTGYGDDRSFGASVAEISFGRYVESTGDVDFWPTVSPTLAAANTAPRIGPIVINEIDYHPAGVLDEFIELRNISGSSVSLFDPANP